MITTLRRFSEDIADGWVLGPVRAVIGALLGYHALVSAEELARVGYWGDLYHASMVPDVLVPSHRLYALLLALRVCLAVMIIVGVWARPALAASSLAGVWMLVCDRNQFHHNRYSLLLYAFLLAFAPCDRSWRATEPSVPEPRTAPFWAVHVAQLQISIVYLASGGSKLLDPDWRNGLVLADRVARYGGQAIALGVPKGFIGALMNPDVASAVAKLAISTELVLCVALWLRPTRVVALWWGVWFHIVIQLTSKVETFTILTLAMYGVFATPDHQARKLRYDPTRPWGKITGTIIPLLDWLGRFEVKPWEPDHEKGHSIVVIRRDGTAATGIRAFAMLTRCVPLLFPIWAPVALFASFTRQGDLTTRG